VFESEATHFYFQNLKRNQRLYSLIVDKKMKSLSQMGIALLTIVSNSHTRNDFLGLNKPFFNPSSSAVILTQVGSVAYLTCEVYNLNNLSVSWIRGRDSHILTVDRETFISDSRFIILTGLSFA
jgi:hypothetical protein